MWRYFIGVNVLTVGLYAQDKLSAMGWMPISIRIPGEHKINLGLTRFDHPALLCITWLRARITFQVAR